MNNVGQREGDSCWQACVVHPRSRRWHSGCSLAQGKLPGAVLQVTAPQNVKVHLLFIRGVGGSLVYPEGSIPGVLVDERLAMSSPCALTAQKENHVLGCIQSSMATRVRDGFLSLYSARVRSHPGVLHPALGSPAQQGLRPVGVSPEEEHQHDQRMEHLSYKERTGIVQPGEGFGVTQLWPSST